MDMMRNKITDESVQLMRDRCGYPNPTVRSGTNQLPWWTVTTSDAIRHHVNGYGDDNPLYVDPDYAAETRWGRLIGPPGFSAAGGPNAHRPRYSGPTGDQDPVLPGEEEAAWHRRLGKTIPEELHGRTRKALRGVQLYASGNDAYYYRPLGLGDFEEASAGGVCSVEEKASEFAGRSAIVGNKVFSWNQQAEITTMRHTWFVHAERRKSSKTMRKPPEPARYTDDQLTEIEQIYADEKPRGGDTLWFEDVSVGDELPKMAKGPLHLTDMWNQHMGSGWYGYGNPALRLGYLNRQKMPGFYSRTQFNSWDVIQRVHWDEALAQEVGVPLLYDIAPMRNSWAIHYCTNFMGDDAWLYHLHTELRSFNYFGDTTVYTGEIIGKRVDGDLGPLIEVAISGLNQRDVENTTATAVILLASREAGAVQLPDPPARLADLAREIHDEIALFADRE